MQRLTRLLVVGAALVGVTGLTAAKADADVLVPFEFNWVDSLGSHNLTPTQPGDLGIAQLNITDPATIWQSSDGAGNIGGTFVETGKFGIDSYLAAQAPYVPGTNVIPDNVLGAVGFTPGNTLAPPGDIAGDAVYFSYTVGGTLSSSGITFTAGAIQLCWTPTTGSLTPTGTCNSIATFTLVNGNSSGAFTLSGNNLTVQSFLFNFVQTGGATTVFTGLNGLEIGFENGSAQPTSTTGFTFTGSSTCTSSLPSFDGIVVTNPLCANINSNGKLAVEVPEPASMAIFGSGLLGLAYFSRRRKKKQS